MKKSATTKHLKMQDPNELHKLPPRLKILLIWKELHALLPQPGHCALVTISEQSLRRKRKNQPQADDALPSPTWNESCGSKIGVICGHYCVRAMARKKDLQTKWRRNA